MITDFHDSLLEAGFEEVEPTNRMYFPATEKDRRRLARGDDFDAVFTREYVLDSKGKHVRATTAPVADIKVGELGPDGTRYTIGKKGDY